jgi:histidinol-phosphate aminotransferase
MSDYGRSGERTSGAIMSMESIYLDRNENLYGPAPACYDVLRAAGVEALSCYSKDPQRGVKSLLTERLARDHGVPEARIQIGYGSEDILKQAVHFFLQPGEALLIPSHSWWYYKSVAAEKNGRTLEYAMVPGEESFQYDVEGLLRLARAEKPRLVLISSPNNPTGNSLGDAEIGRVLRELKDTVIILDQAYWGFGGEGTTPVRELLEQHPRLIILRTFSKYYALAGIRAGYGFMGAGLDDLIRSGSRYLGYNRVSERLALAALDSPAYYADIRSRMIEDKAAMRLAFNRIKGFKVYRSDANFFLADVPAAHKEALKTALTGRGLIIKFFKNEAFLDNSVRITLGTREQNRRLIEAVTAFAGEHGLL